MRFPFDRLRSLQNSSDPQRSFAIVNDQMETRLKKGQLHSYAMKGKKHHLNGRGDKKAIDADKYQGSTQICDVPKNEHNLLANFVRGFNLGLCQKNIVKKGCYEDAAKQLGGKMLINEEAQIYWNFDYDNRIYDFYCRCSKAALKNGYTLFGITDHAHCWGFNGTEASLASMKKSSGCVNASSIKTTCTENDRFCSGSIRPLWGSLKSVSSFVYLVMEKRKYRPYWRTMLGYAASPSLFLPEEAPTINVDKNKREYIIHGNTTFHVAPWESRVIPFVMDPSIDADVAGKLVRGLYHLEKYTCVKFRRKMSNERMKSGYLHFQQPNHAVCYSLPGRRVNQPNYVNITSACKRGAVVHEIMHAFGFLHEQMRADRDEYVDIKFDNLKKKWLYIVNYQTGKEAFGQGYIGSKLDVPYDFNSLMHYAERMPLVSINPNKTVLEVKDKWKKICDKNKYGCILGHWRGLSKSDAIQVNKMFKCEIKPQTTSWGCPVYTTLDEFKSRYFGEFRKDLCLRLNLKQ